MLMWKLSSINLHLKKFKASPFICQKKQAQCRIKLHQSCFKIQFEVFLYKIQKKVLNVEQYVFNHDQMVYQFVDTIIDEASRMKELYKQYAEKQDKLFLFTEKQTMLWKILHENNVSQIKKYQFSILFKQIFQKSQKLTILSHKQRQGKTLEIWTSIQSHILKRFKQFQSQLLSQNIFQSLFSQKDTLFQKSNIIKSLGQKETMLKLLGRKIKNAEILYKASQNQFKFDNFYANCTGIPNILLLVQTQFNKKVGAYTPLCWKKVQKSESLADGTNSSFMFSLSHKQKLRQTSLTESGIHNGKDFGPIFGSGSTWDMYISNQANKNSYSSIRFSYGYSNQTFKRTTTSTLQKFNGSLKDQHKVKLKQWQIWRTIYQK